MWGRRHRVNEDFFLLSLTKRGSRGSGRRLSAKSSFKKRDRAGKRALPRSTQRKGNGARARTPAPLQSLDHCELSDATGAGRARAQANADEEELLDYEEEEEHQQTDASSKKAGGSAIHATGFRDFLLRPELLRAIVDCGFEHPSEGTPSPSYLLAQRNFSVAH